MPVEPTVATDVLVLLHVPPVAVSARVMVDPTHTFEGPVIAGTTGNGLTVTTAVTIVVQPKPLVTLYVIVAVPAAPAVIFPAEPMVATEVLLLLHVPPVVVLFRVVVAPWQALIVPVIAATVGNGLMVTIAVTIVVQPKPLVTLYVILEVPAATPDTMPVEPTVAIDVLPLLHVPPVVVLFRVAVAPWQVLIVPVIADAVGSGLTVIVAVAIVVQLKPLVTM